MTESQRKAMERAVAAIELAQDNLRPHGENCFLHDEGEYNSCFCGLDSLTVHLLTVTESLAAALAEPAPEPVRGCGYDETTGNCTQNPCCLSAPAPLLTDAAAIKVLREALEFITTATVPMSVQQDACWDSMLNALKETEEFK